jgi:hypothetical protein
MTANIRRIALSIAFAGLALVSTHPAQAAFTRQFHGHTYVWPDIGTPAYSAGCEIVQWWEDGGAVAYCPEDGETWVYDPDGNKVSNSANNPVREPGWYVAPEILQIGPDAPVSAR